MPQTIWKFPLELTDVNRVTMPAQSHILHVGMQGETLCLWALVAPEASKVTRVIAIRGTGHPCNIEHTRHVGSVFDRQFVWHVFDCGES